MWECEWDWAVVVVATYRGDSCGWVVVVLATVAAAAAPVALATVAAAATVVVYFALATARSERARRASVAQPGLGSRYSWGKGTC